MNDIDIDIVGRVVVGHQDDGSSVRERLDQAPLDELGESFRRLREEPFTVGQAEIEHMGAAMGNVLLTGAIGDMVIAGLASGGVRIRLSVDSPAMAVLPWEIVRLRGHLLSVSSQALFSRRPTGFVFGTKEPVALKGALIVVPETSDLQGEEEAESVRSVLEKAGVSYVTLSGRLTVKTLGEALGTGRFQILHYIGHGVEDGLLLYNDNGSPSLVAGVQFRSLLSLCDCMRLVVLNGCLTGAVTGITEEGNMTGMAASAVASGIPAAVAMQYPVADALAATFARSFYAALVDPDGKGDVARATQAGRNACYFENPGNRSWCAPVVYLRSKDGSVFLLPPAPGAGAPPASASDAYSHESVDSLIGSIRALRRQADVWQVRMQQLGVASALGGPVAVQPVVESAQAQAAYEEAMYELDERTEALRVRLDLLRLELVKLEEKQQALVEAKNGVMATGRMVPYSLEREAMDVRFAAVKIRRQIEEGEGIVTHRG